MAEWSAHQSDACLFGMIERLDTLGGESEEANLLRDHRDGGALGVDAARRAADAMHVAAWRNETE